MASISFDRRKNRWRVAQYIAGEKKYWAFKDEAEARAFHAALPPSKRNRRNRADVIAHLAANFEVDDSGCWVWTGRLTNAGYAGLTWTPSGGDLIPGGHRVVLAAIGDPVPSGLVVDHLCRNRACINPDHLDVVTQRENIMRSPIAPGAQNAAKTHCPRGHEYSEENTATYLNPGGRKTRSRVCKTCSRSRYVQRRAVSA